MTINHSSVRPEHAPTNEKAAPGGTGTASNAAFNEHHFTATDPIQGWNDLAKPSRNRQQKRSWTKGARR